MAIIYGKDRETDYASGNLAPIGKSYSRMGAAPLDMYEVWYDKEALIAYASNLGTPQADGSYDTSSVLSYVGQKVAYVDEQNKKIFHYSIELDGTLKEIGNTFLEGALIDISAANAKGEVTISHEKVAAPVIVAGTGRTYITNVETDGYGHITKLYTATETDQEIDIPVVLEGTYIDITVNDDGDYVVNHENAPTLSVTNAETNASRFITEITRDDQGHITGYKTEKVLIPDVTLDKLTIDRNSKGEIEIKGAETAQPDTDKGLLPQLIKDESGNKKLQWVTIDRAIEGATKDTITIGDGTSIQDKAGDTSADHVLEIKGVRESDNAGKILSTDGKGNVTWVVDQDTDTKTGVKAGNDGVEVTLQEIPDQGDDRTYIIKHVEITDNTEGNFAPITTGEQTGKHINNILIDEFGHVISIQEVDEVTYSLGATGHGDNTATIDLYNSFFGEDPVSDLYVTGSNGIEVSVDGSGLDIKAPDLELDSYDASSEYENEDTITVVKELVSGENGHAIQQNLVTLPTKQYVDKVVTNGVDYLGTISSFDEVENITNPIGAGDFVRVAQAFDFGENDKAHVGDVLIATVDNPGKTMENWDLIHTEIDANTWVANTKDADGYVTKGKDDPNSVWATNENGEPGWMVYDVDATNSTIVQRDTSGEVYGYNGDPGSEEIVGQLYIDGYLKQNELISAKAIQHLAVLQVSDAEKVYVTDADGKQTQVKYSKSDISEDVIVARGTNGAITVPETPEANTDAASKKYVDDAKQAAINAIGNGKFTVSGTGYLTGSGEMTANQAGDTTATLDLTADAKAKIDNAMPKLPEAERAGAEGHYAMFDKDGQVVDGGYIAALTDVLNTRAPSDTYAGQDGYLEFKIYEKLQDNDEQLLSYKLAVNKNSGLKLTQTDNSPYIYDENNLTAEQGASVYGELELSDATMASLAKADSAVQNVEFRTETVYPETHGSETADVDNEAYTTGFRLDINKGDNETVSGEFALSTASEDGIVFAQNQTGTGGCADVDTYVNTQISLAPWAKERILDSVTEVATTANQGLKATTTYTYYDEAQYKEVTTTSQPYDVVDYTKKTTIDIDESVTFILNCGSAADLL